MQPTYLPWAGYFNLISAAKHFVFLDDVQFEKSSWQNRNRLLLDGAAKYISVPTQRRSLAQLLNDIATDEQQNWRRKHIAMIQQIYGRHPFGKDVIALVSTHLADKSANLLSDINISIIQSCSERLEIDVEMHRASDLNIEGLRSERLISISRHFGCMTYLSPIGAREYLELDGSFASSSPIELKYQEYSPQRYPQHRFEGWVSHLSIIDVVANIGWNAAAKYVRSGQHTTE
jgi:hypothetical protein